MHNVLDKSFFYNNTVRPDILEGWHFTHMRKTLA